MERKITHYVVKQEHARHVKAVLGVNQACVIVSLSGDEEKTLREAKVLDLWACPVYEKHRVKGWYNVYSNSLKGPYSYQDKAEEFSGKACKGQIFIDQEIASIL